MHETHHPLLAGRLRRGLGAVAMALSLAAFAQEAALVYLTDFSVRDGAVSAMKGVAFGVSPKLAQFDLTHEVPPFNIWEGACRLKQTAAYWPSNTVFVCVVDPGVGTERKSVVCRTQSGHTFVGPNNGLFTFVPEALGTTAVREIDLARHRLPGSAESYTFHGRDVFAYVGAQIAVGRLGFADVGPVFAPGVQRIPHQAAELKAGTLHGTIPVLDVQYGNVWSNVGRDTFARLGAQIGDRFSVRIRKAGKTVCRFEAPYVATFGDVPPGKPLLFLNSLLEVSVALNQASLAGKHHIGSGPDWSLEVRPLPRKP